MFFRWLFLCIIMISPARAASDSIGAVTQQVGNTVIERKAGESLKAQKGSDVVSYDTIKTGQGKTAIEFLDETRVDVTQNSKLIIDEFVYDPATSTGKLALKASFGTIRYASGQIAKNSRQDIKISTPTASIGVRGTDFTMTVDETGSSTIVLTSDIGTVILNQAFQATVVDTPKSNPLKPIIIDINERLIDNLLIIRKPKALKLELEIERAKDLADFLGFDYLEFDGTNYRHLANRLRHELFRSKLFSKRT